MTDLLALRDVLSPSEMLDPFLQRHLRESGDASGGKKLLYIEENARHLIRVIVRSVQRNGPLEPQL